MNEDVTPDGDPIDTRTIWLEFPEGEVALTADLTRLNAALRRASEPTMWDRALAAAAEFDSATKRLEAVLATTSAQNLIVEFGLSDPCPWPRFRLWGRHK